MKNGIITGVIVLAGMGGLALLNSNSDRKNLTEGDNDFSVERSYEETGDRDCGDFSSQREAQRFFEDEGGPSTDYQGLDRDGDGVVCESL